MVTSTLLDMCFTVVFGPKGIIILSYSDWVVVFVGPSWLGAFDPFTVDVRKPGLLRQEALKHQFVNLL